jgi:hypothetical protein
MLQVCNPRAFRIVRGYDIKSNDFAPNLERGKDSIVTLAVDAVNAGAGKLEAELQLPSGDRIKTEVVVSKERADVRFSPYEPGEYSLSVKFNGFPLPFCPLKGRLMMDEDDEDSAPASTSGQVKLTGVGLVKARVNEDNYFMIGTLRALAGADLLLKLHCCFRWLQVFYWFPSRLFTPPRESEWREHGRGCGAAVRRQRRVRGQLQPQTAGELFAQYNLGRATC